MPKMASGNKVKQSELPETLERSSAKAQRTFAKAHDRAVEQYGEGERAHRTAYAALKQTHERKGDRWVAKDQPGPSDPRSKQATTEAKRSGRGETYDGVDAERTRSRSCTGAPAGSGSRAARRCRSGIWRGRSQRGSDDEEG